MKRYTIGVTIDEELEVEPSNNGEWVRWEDCQQLLQENSRLRELLGKAEGCINDSVAEGCADSEPLLKDVRDLLSGYGAEPRTD